MGENRRVGSDLAPVIALREGKPVLAVATIGASLTPETVRLTAGLLHRPADADTLAAAPPLLINIDPFQPTQPVAQRLESVPADGYSPAWSAAVGSSGIILRTETATQVQTLRGTAAFAVLDPAGFWTSAETPTVMTFVESP